MEKEKPKDPNIYEYDDYRAFLRDYYDTKKKTKKIFSFRYFSRVAGFQSPNLLKRVMEGERNLTPKSIRKFCKALNFDFDQSEFYRNLVHFNQAKTFKEKQNYAKKLTSFADYMKIKPGAKTQFEYWSEWFNPIVYELVGLKGFKEDPNWIANTLEPSITPSEASRSLKQLEEIGLLKRDENGQLVQDKFHIFAHDGVVSASILHFHREMISRARESLDRFKQKDRFITNMTFSIEEAEMNEIKFMMEKFNNDLIEKIQQAKRGSRVFQINFQAFPLTQPALSGNYNE